MQINRFLRIYKQVLLALFGVIALAISFYVSLGKQWWLASQYLFIGILFFALIRIVK